MKKNVLITGGTGNLGRAVVERFVTAGYNVLATVTAGKPSGLPANDVHTFEVDLTNEKEVESTVGTIASKFSSIDAALLLVGGFAAGSIKDTDGAMLRKMYALNFETAYFTVRPTFLQMMKQPSGGRIVLVGSRPSLLVSAGKNMVAYSFSKSLLFRLAEILNAEGAAHDVVTSVVVPSTIDTPVNRQSMPDADFSKWVTPEEIASLMLFIADNKDQREPVYKIYGAS